VPDPGFIPSTTPQEKKKEKKTKARHLWLTPIILVIQEVEIRRISV
jgi:hypothetical protein